MPSSQFIGKFFIFQEPIALAHIVKGAIVNLLKEKPKLLTIVSLSLSLSRFEKVFESSKKLLYSCIGDERGERERERERESGGTDG